MYRKLLGRVSVLPQTPSIAIGIASSSCLRAVLVQVLVFAGELVEFESLLALKKKRLVHYGRAFRQS